MRRLIRLLDEQYEVTVQRGGERAVLLIGDVERRAEIHQIGEAEYRLDLDGESHRVWLACDDDKVYVHAFGQSWELVLADPYDHVPEEAGSGSDVATAPMPGVIVEVLVQPDTRVREGQALLIMESMKLQSTITAWRDGVVESVHVADGQNVERGTTLVKLVQEDD